MKPPTNNPMAFFNGLATITDTNMLGTGPITLGGSTLSFSQNWVISSNSPITVVSNSTLTLFRDPRIQRRAERRRPADAQFDQQQHHGDPAG